MDTQNVSIRIVHDNDPPNPREERMNLGTMACWHRRYKLGDVRPQELPDVYKETDIKKGSVVLPLFLLDHSGITISTQPFHDPWDSGWVGWIFATPKVIREQYCVNRITKKLREIALKCLISEVEEYNDFLTGNAWGYVIENSRQEIDSDSCFGFLGDEAIEAMKICIPEELHKQLEEAWKRRDL